MQYPILFSAQTNRSTKTMRTSRKNVQPKEHKQNGWEHFELGLKFNKIKYAACFIIDPDPITKQLSDLT